MYFITPLNADLNPICRLLALLGAHHILHVSRIRVKVNILASQCAHSTNDLVCYVGLKITD